MSIDNNRMHENNSGKTRKCGNCKQLGHSIRTCEKMLAVSRTRADGVAKAARDRAVSREV